MDSDSKQNPSGSCLSVSRTACTALRSVWPGYSDQEESSRQEEASRFEAHTRFDEAVSDSRSGAGLGTASWLLPTSTLGS
jgi:hypothetical protein